MKHAKSSARGIFALLALTTCAWSLPATADCTREDNFTKDEITVKAEVFFGAMTEGLASVIEKVFKEQGRPNAYIAGSEASGAIGVGLRYGEGTLFHKCAGSRKVFWQGPSVGWDVGANASKTFVLIYNLKDNDALFQRFPGVEGTFYYVAGAGVNYQRSGGITLAPIRTGVGLRAGANIGYLHYTRKHSWLPL
ncbi:MAG: DUF1134 domain-containing protein [Nevskiales bacterium]